MQLERGFLQFPIMKLLPLFIAVFSSAFLCSCGFNSAYNKAVTVYEAAEYKAPSGPWQGTWTTNTNGHSGDLRAIVTPSSDEPGEYDFRYHATWGKIFSGSYTVSYDVDRRGNRYFVNGEENLGFFGRFGHKAIIDNDAFEATFSSEDGDLGDFSLRRPE